MLDFFKACAILFSAGRASRLRQGQGGHDRPAESTSPKEMRTRERLSFALFFSASAEATADASSLTFESDAGCWMLDVMRFRACYALSRLVADKLRKKTKFFCASLWQGG